MDYKLSLYFYFFVVMLIFLELCDILERLSFVFFKKEYFNMNFFLVGIIVEYECRLGFRK